MKVSIHKIAFLEKRQRRDWDSLDISIPELAESIRANGQYQNIGIDQNFIGIFGETRFKAFHYLVEKYVE